MEQTTDTKVIAKKIKRIEITGNANVIFRIDATNNDEININSDVPILCTVIHSELFIKTTIDPNKNNEGYFLNWKMNYSKSIMKILHKVFFIGSGSITIYDIICGEHSITFILTGSGDINIHNMSNNKMYLSLTGSGNINLHNTSSDKIDIELVGSGNINFHSCTFDKIKTKLYGSGKIN